MQNIQEYSCNIAFSISHNLDQKARKYHTHRTGMSLNEYLTILKKMDREQLKIEVESHRFDKLMYDPGNREGRIMKYYIQVYQPLFLLAPDIEPATASKVKIKNNSK